MALKLNPFKKRGGAAAKGDTGRGGVKIDPLTPIEARPDIEIEADRGMVRVGKTRYATKLIWTEKTSDTPRMQLEAISSGDVVSRNLYVTDERAVGFGSTDLGHKKGMPPLAMSIDTDIVGDSFYGAFSLNGEDDEEGHWWVVGRVDGIVRQDITLPSEEAARNFLMAQTNRIHGMRIIAPDEWNLDVSVPGRLKDVIRLNRKAIPKIRRFGMVRNNLGMIVLGTMALIVFGGGYLTFAWMNERKAQLAQEERDRQERRIRINDVDYPWFGTVKTEDFVLACQDALSRMMVAVPGWAVEPLGCSMNDTARPGPSGARPVTAAASWTRETEGRIGWLRQAFPGGHGDQITMAPNGQAAGMNVQIDPAFDASYFKNAPWEASAINRNVVERFQNHGLEATFTEETRAVRGRSDAPIFNSHTISIVTGYDPMEWAGLVRDVPAMVPLALTWNPGTGEWGFTGRIYHTPILPPGAIGAY